MRGVCHRGLKHLHFTTGFNSRYDFVFSCGSVLNGKVTLKPRVYVFFWRLDAQPV